jgi:hypothetical protein
MIEMTHRVDHRTQELHGLAGRIRHERTLRSPAVEAEPEPTPVATPTRSKPCPERPLGDRPSHPHAV